MGKYQSNRKYSDSFRQEVVYRVESGEMCSAACLAKKAIRACSDGPWIQAFRDLAIP